MPKYSRHRMNKQLGRYFSLSIGILSISLLLAACSSTPTKTTSVATKTKTSLHSLLPSNIAKSGVIINGSPETNPPYMFLTNGKLTSIDYDLGQAMAKELGVHIVWKDIPSFSGLIPALLSGKINMSLSILSDTPPREKEITFVDYALDGVAFLTTYANRNRLPVSTNNFLWLCGVTAGSTTGAIEAAYLKHLSNECISAHKPPITLLTYPNPADELLSLQSGHTLVALHGGAASYYVSQTVNGGKAYRVLGREFLASYEGIGLAKGETKLAHALSVALQDLIKNGTYAKILSKYGMSRLAIDVAQARMNTATSKVPLTASQKAIYGSSSPYIES